MELSSDPNYETIRTTFDLTDGGARFAIFRDGSIIGCLIVYFPQFRQIGIWVRDDLRSLGHGTSLLLKVLQRIDNYPVFSVIDVSNDASLAIFRKCGFRALSTRSVNRDRLVLGSGPIDFGPLA